MSLVWDSVDGSLNMVTRMILEAMVAVRVRMRMRMRWDWGSKNSKMLDITWVGRTELEFLDNEVSVRRNLCFWKRKPKWSLLIGIICSVQPLNKQMRYQWWYGLQVGNKLRPSHKLRKNYSHIFLEFHASPWILSPEYIWITTFLIIPTQLI